MNVDDGTIYAWRSSFLSELEGGAESSRDPEELGKLVDIRDAASFKGCLFAVNSTF